VMVATQCPQVMSFTVNSIIRESSISINWGRTPINQS
jgi:hypothetical protein